MLLLLTDDDAIPGFSLPLLLFPGFGFGGVEGLADLRWESGEAAATAAAADAEDEAAAAAMAADTAAT